MNHLSEKVKRAATSLLLPVDKARIGNCKNCGACCMFVYRCPFLNLEKHRAICTIHRIRPPMCRKYPRTKAEQIHKPCGYSFIN
ncbi:YkgJ family cysteine cluster protein [Candidatus Methanoperedens nitratireducens]|uniref:YkgJ family cysteine cluster protein n=1 Tax=Candidatus Methanoperedens nitratireducens TaxID=1392998 RepID=UPI0012FE86B5